MESVSVSIAGVFILMLVIFWVSGGLDKMFVYLARRQEMKHKERMARIEASKKNKGDE